MFFFNTKFVAAMCRLQFSEQNIFSINLDEGKDMANPLEGDRKNILKSAQPNITLNNLLIHQEIWLS